MFDEFTVTSTSGPWTGINGLVVVGRSTPRPAAGARMAGGEAAEAVDPAGDAVEELTVSAVAAGGDPLRPAMAVAGVNALPARGFLRLQLDRPMGPDFKVRVDLVDRSGQRFTIWENLGASYFGPSDDVWLNLEDFHVYFWGRCRQDPAFRAQEVDEILLRFECARANEPHVVRLSLLKGRR